MCSYTRIISSFILLKVWKEEYEYLELFGHRSVKLTIRKECSLHLTSRGIFQVVVIDLNHLCDVFSSLSFPIFISAVDFITMEIGRGILNIKLIVPYLINFSIICLEKAMAPYSSTLAWKIPWMEEPGGLQSMGSRRVGQTERLHFYFSLSCIGEGNGNPLQCSCLENPRDGGAWWAAIYGVAQSWTLLK